MILDNIAEMVAAELKTNPHQNNRKQRNVLARAVYYRLAREYTPYSLQRIADVFNKDHATALYGFRMFENFKLQPTLYTRELAAYETIGKVLKKVKVKKNETHIEKLIRDKEVAEQERDDAIELAEKTKYRLDRLIRFLNGFYKTDKYDKYAEL